MTEFEYQPQEGVLLLWTLTMSGYGEEYDGDFDAMELLSDIEATIENCEEEYRQDSGSSIVTVRGAHGWREFEWDNGATHRYEWSHFLLDLRCSICSSPDNDLYVVTDELWQSSGLDGRACFRCLEQAIGRQLVPDDFIDVPANDEQYTRHGPELRARIGRS